jgi:ribosome-binding protein aMBF1 (putative translation factor)
MVDESSKTKAKAKARAKAKKRARAQKVVPNRDATVNVVSGVVTDYDGWVAEAKQHLDAMQFHERKLANWLIGLRQNLTKKNWLSLPKTLVLSLPA